MIICERIQLPLFLYLNIYIIRGHPVVGNPHYEIVCAACKNVINNLAGADHHQLQKQGYGPIRAERASSEELSRLKKKKKKKIQLVVRTL